jgi:hypothetical protein
MPACALMASESALKVTFEPKGRQRPWHQVTGPGRPSTGPGGQGVLSLGATLATTAMLEGKQVAYLPRYGVEVRGGTANWFVEP